MIRPFTCLSALLAFGSGLYLYQTKHAAQLLDHQIGKTADETKAMREQTRVLQAEWTLLNDPDRLRQFADQYLALKPLQPSQFASLGDLDQRLPAPRPEPVAAPSVSLPPTAGDAPEAQTAAAPSEPAVAEAEEAFPLPPLPPAAAPTAGPPARLADPHPVDPRPPAAAPAHPPTAADPHPVIAARPPDPRVVVARPVQTASTAALSAARVPPLQPPPVTGSLLGMAHSGLPAPAPVPLPRPTPVNTAQWANDN
jgi:hypothetical protein